MLSLWLQAETRHGRICVPPTIPATQDAEPTLVTATTLFDVPAFSTKQIAEIAAVLIDKVDRVGWDALPVDEQVELRLVRTLLDGFADTE